MIVKYKSTINGMYYYIHKSNVGLQKSNQAILLRARERTKTNNTKHTRDTPFLQVASFHDLTHMTSQKCILHTYLYIHISIISKYIAARLSCRTSHTFVHSCHSLPPSTPFQQPLSTFLVISYKYIHIFIYNFQ